MKDLPWLIAKVLMALAFGITLGRILTGCTVDAVHRVAIDVDLSDPCLLAFPLCSGGRTRCVDVEGVEMPECQVACIAARDLDCVDTGDGFEPICYQYFGEDQLQVPTICMTP